MGPRSRRRGVAITVGLMLVVVSSARSAVWSVHSLPANGVGVSCVSARFCAAVTGDGAMSWRGGRWELQATPDPVPGNAPPILGRALGGVSCTSVSSCVAVGSYATTTYVSATKVIPKAIPLAERWDGVRWSLLAFPEVPSGAPAAWLDTVSCVPDGGCMAVGLWDRGGDTGASGPLAEWWDGNSWSIESMPDPASVFAGASSAGIGGLSCSSNTSCMAVGSFYNGAVPSVGETYAERWDGSSWSFQPTAQVAGAFEAQLTSVSCTSPRDCVAVGASGFDPTQPVSRALAERWDGTGWSLQAAPNAPGAYTDLHGVSCTSSHACVAIGATALDHVFRPLVQRWDGTRWSFERTPNAPGASLNAVSCTSSIVCTAVGSVAEQSAPATAKLTGMPAACAAARFTARVTGTAISSVTWRLDGRTIKGHSSRRGSRYVASIRLAPGRHTVTVNVKFAPDSQTQPLILRRDVVGCSPTR
jgi:hypothetical protein